MDWQWKIPQIEGLKRKEIPLYELHELREVIVNAVVHRDYKQMHQPVKVDLFSHRIERENPGTLLPGITALNMIHKQGCRNPLFADLFSRIGYGDMDGQGIDRLMMMVQKQMVPAPQFVVSDRSFKVILSGPKRWEEFYPEEKRSSVIALVLINSTIDNALLRRTFSISVPQASNILKSLVNDNTLVAEGPSKRFLRYRLSPLLKRLIYS